MLGGLFTDASLFFEVDKLEGVVFGGGREAGDVLGKYIELCHARGPQTKEPDL